MLAAIVLASALLCCLARQANCELPASSQQAGGHSSDSRPTSQAASQPASQAASKPAAEEVTLAAIQAALTRLEETKNLDSAVKSQAQTILGEAQQQIKAGEAWDTTTAKFIKDRADAPALLSAAQARLAQSRPAETVETPPNITLGQLEQLSAQANTNLMAARRKLTDMEDEPRRRTERGMKIAQILVDTYQQIQDVTNQLAVPAPAQEAPEASSARKLMMQAQKQTLRKQALAMRSELLAIEASRELLTAQRDEAARKVQQAQKQDAALRELLNNRRRMEADQLAAEARKARLQAASADKSVQDAAAVNETLANVRVGPEGLSARIERVNADYSQTFDKLTRLRIEAKNIRERVEAAGLTNAIGLMLRRQRASLPDVDTLERQARERKAEISQAQLEWIKYRDDRNSLDDIDATVAELLAGRSDLQEPQRKEVAVALRRQLEIRKKYLESLQNEYNVYSGRLVQLDAINQLLLGETQKYLQYIDERVLWTRSASPISVHDLPAAMSALAWLTNPAEWTNIGKALVTHVNGHPLPTAGTVLLLMVIVVFQSRLRRKLNSLREIRPGKPNEIGHLIAIIVLSLLLVSMAPTAIYLAAVTLQEGAAHLELGLAISAALRMLAGAFLTIRMILELSRPNGMLQSQYHWSDQAVKKLRRRLVLLSLFLLPLMMVVEVTENQNAEIRKESLGRLAFIACQFALWLFLARVLRPAGSAMNQAMQNAPNSLLHRLRHLWYTAIILVPLALAITAGMGYYYTAIELSWRMYLSLWLCMGLAVLYTLFHQWMLVARRAVGLLLAQHRLNARKDPASRETPNPERNVHTREVLGLATMREQSQRLLVLCALAALFIGLGAIWVDIVPALGVLKRVELWNYTAKTTSVIRLADGGSSSQTIDKLVPVTLADLAMALAVLALTFVASRNVPAVIQMSLLKRLRVTGGAYAVTAITSYIITVGGIITACGFIGLTWSSVQWLVAAITVGLGFGLQEIFANFVSGIILLFERPIRVGDIVTVGEITGVVTKIRIRATTITDYDLKDLVVPNKEFITSKLVNWTLSDTRLRLTITIRVPHGTDTDFVRQTLLDLASKHPLVLKDPSPSTSLVCFLPNSIRFDLQAYTNNMKDNNQARDELSRNIEKAFAAAGIVLR